MFICGVLYWILLGFCVGMTTGSFGSWRRFGFNFFGQRFSVYVIIITTLGTLVMFTLLHLQPIPRYAMLAFMAYPYAMLPAFCLTFTALFLLTAEVTSRMSGTPRIPITA